MATAWYDGATLDCAIAYNILLHQQDQALRGVSPLVPLEEREHFRTAPFGASSLFDELTTKLQLQDKAQSATRLYPIEGARHLLPSVKHVLLHIGQHRLDPCNDSRLLYQCHCRSPFSSPFWPLEDVVQDVNFTNEEDDDTGQDYLCPRTRAPVSPIIMRPSTLDPLDIPQQVVVFLPLLIRKVGTLSLVCDVWR